MSEQVAMEESFKKEQKANNVLKHCWGQVQQINRENQNPNQAFLMAYFLVKATWDPTTPWIRAGSTGLAWY